MQHVTPQKSKSFLPPIDKNDNNMASASKKNLRLNISHNMNPNASQINKMIIGMEMRPNHMR